MSRHSPSINVKSVGFCVKNYLFMVALVTGTAIVSKLAWTQCWWQTPVWTPELFIGKWVTFTSSDWRLGLLLLSVLAKLLFDIFSAFRAGSHSCPEAKTQFNELFKRSDSVSFWQYFMKLYSEIPWLVILLPSVENPGMETVNIILLLACFLFLR